MIKTGVFNPQISFRVLLVAVAVHASVFTLVAKMLGFHQGMQILSEILFPVYLFSSL